MHAMKLALAALAVALTPAVAAAQAPGAQRLQEVYERLCAPGGVGGAATCAALRGDLDAVARRAAAEGVAQDRAAWGVLADLPGRTYLYSTPTGDVLNTFAWATPYVEMRVVVQSLTFNGSSTFRITRTAANRLRFDQQVNTTKTSWEGVVEADGSVRFANRGMFSSSFRYARVSGAPFAYDALRNPMEMREQLRRSVSQVVSEADVPRLRARAMQAQQQAAQQKAADRSAFWGAVGQGLAASVPILAGQDSGASALASLPAMREDGSAPNLLETLNGVSAQLQQQNAQGKARLDAMIADGYAQEERQRRAREEADRLASVRLQAERQQRDRELATQVIGQGRQQIEQSLAQARASGDKALEQRALQALQTNEAYAREKGVAAEVRQYAGAGKLGQTPIGPLPAPNVVRTPRPAPGPAAETQRFGRGELGCHDHALSESPFQCDRDGDKPGARPGPGRGAGGGTQIASGGGTGPRPAPGVPPGGGQPGVQYETRQESVTLCELTGPQAQYGNWRCTGSTQWSLVNFQHPNWQAEVLMTCAGNGPVRDLGTVGVYRAFGCSRALGPRNAGDIPGSHGITYVAGRMTFRCRTDRTECVS